MNGIQGLLTYDEMSKTLYRMKNNKSPGSDGFSSDFFKCFWVKLGFFVLRSINHGYLTGELSTTQKQGIIITCLPKGDKARHFLARLFEE